MPDSSKKPRVTSANKMDAPSAVEWLRSRGTKANRDGMARYAIPSDRALRSTFTSPTLRDRNFRHSVSHLTLFHCFSAGSTPVAHNS
jgi:hypothetical protein